MSTAQYCQSCGMPITKDEEKGTDSDGKRNEEYCTYCYQNGAFTADVSMEQMINICAEHVDKWPMKITKEDAIAMMKEHFPNLKRWKNQA